MKAKSPEASSTVCIASLASWLVAILLLAASVATFALSLNHPVNADLAMLHYSAWLINEQHFVFYRDIFELNFPGPFLLHCLLGRTIGYEALPLRWLDLVLLLALGATSWKILAPLSRPAAVFAPCLFTLVYLLDGGIYVLERDYLTILPAALAFLVTSKRCFSLGQQALVAGALAAISCSMKPNAVVVAPVLAWMLWQQCETGNRIKVLAIFVASMAAVAAVPFLWVLRTGGIDAFIDIYHHFVPIYTSTRSDLRHYGSDSERLQSLMTSYLQFGGLSFLLAVPGLLWARVLQSDNPVARQHIRHLAVMLFASTLYEVIAGKFWLNHLFPSAYWTCLGLALLLATPAPGASHRLQLAACVLWLVPAAVGWYVASISLPQMRAAYLEEKEHAAEGRARQVADYLLQQHLQAGERVQVLDVAGDGQAALLLARATSATRHLIDVPLYLQPDSAVTRRLRAEFLDDLDRNPPRFIVYFDEFLHPGGGNRLHDFRALSAWVETHYEIAAQSEGFYTIYRRKP